MVGYTHSTLLSRLVRLHLSGLTMPIKGVWKWASPLKVMHFTPWLWLCHRLKSSMSLSLACILFLGLVTAFRYTAGFLTTLHDNPAVEFSTLQKARAFEVTDFRLKRVWIQFVWQIWSTNNLSLLHFPSKCAYSLACHMIANAIK